MSDSRILVDSASTPDASTGSLLPVREPSKPTTQTRHPVPTRRRAYKPPKDTKVYKTAVAYIALRAQGYSRAEIAEQLGLASGTLGSYVAYANKKGWLNFDTLTNDEDRVDIVLKSKAVRNINTVLDERNEDNPEVLTGRAVDVSLEVAKGLGVLKQHQVVKNDAPTTSVALAVKIEMPAIPSDALVPRAGSIGGRPFYEAEVVE